MELPQDEVSRYRKLKERTAELTPNDLYEGDIIVVRKEAWNACIEKPLFEQECRIEHFWDDKLFVIPLNAKYCGRYIDKDVDITRKVRSFGRF